MIFNNTYEIPNLKEKEITDMLKADITLMDNTILNQVMLFKSKDLKSSQIYTKVEAEELLDFESNRVIYFCGKYVHGSLIVKHIMEYQLFEESDSIEAKIKEFVLKNNTVVDTNDTAEYIIEYREQLLQLLR